MADLSSSTSLEPRSECARCGRPTVVCYCAQVRPIQTRTRVVVLQHPRESDKAIGTARIASLCLPQAHTFVGIDFAREPGLAPLLSDPARPAALLYPGPAARDLAEHPADQPLTLVVIDGTWHQARSLMSKNPQLAQLPRYAFAPERPSEYRIRREPREDYVSTVEALAYALSLLERDAALFEALLAPFRRMVETQLSFAQRSSGGRHRARRRQHSPARARLPAQLLAPDLLCVTGEANAWPHDRTLRRPPHPHELVHWLAVRLADGARFESLLAPRLPLSKSPVIHALLTPEALHDGAPLESFLRAWQAFQRPDDVLCCWGHYACDLLRREGGLLPEQVVDIRKVAGDYLKARPGSLEQLVEAQVLPYTVRGQARGGIRLGMLEAVTRWLSREARSERAGQPTAQPVQPCGARGAQPLEAQADAGVGE